MLAESQDATHLFNGTFYFSINQTMANEAREIKSIKQEGEGDLDSGSIAEEVDEISNEMISKNLWEIAAQAIN